MDNQTVGVDLDEESREQKVCIHPLATRPVLYTDTVGGNQACRDDLWAVTTDELNDLARRAEPSVAAGDERAPEPAPESSLPDWSECNRIIENHEFRQRAAAGLEGQVFDLPPTTPEPSALHRFIYEYDDADSHRSAWFLYRLEQVINEVRATSSNSNAANACEPTDLEIMQEWDRQREKDEASDTPFLRIIVGFARHWLARAALASPAVSQQATMFDDGSTFQLTGWAGGASPGGEFSTVMCEHRKPDGTVEFINYVREPAVSQKAAPVAPADWINAAVRDVAELPDRDSPDGQPDMMLVSADELRVIIERHASATQQAVSQMDGAAVDDPMSDKWHSLTCDGTCSPPCKDATSTTAATTASASIENESELQFNATRLRNVARLVGMESAIPRDNATLDGARGSVLGMIAGKLRTILAQQGAARVPSLDAILNCYSPDDTASDYQDKIREIYASHAANAGEDTEKPLAHGHRDDYYLLANARSLIESPKAETRRMPNWVLAMRLFATGSTSAHQICADAGIDPDGFKVDRAALASSAAQEGKA